MIARRIKAYCIKVVLGLSGHCESCCQDIALEVPFDGRTTVFRCPKCNTPIALDFTQEIRTN